MSDRFELQGFAQITIILSCAVLLGFQFSLSSSQAQSGCWPNEPPPDYPDNPIYGAYPQGSTWNVKIFDRSDLNPTSDAEFNAVDASIRDWNSVKVSGCSNVTWMDATRAGRGWRGAGMDIPEPNNVFVVRTTDRSGQFRGIYGGLTGLKAAWVYMHSDYNLQTTDVHHRVDNLVKHEVAHGYGLRDGSIGAPPAVIGEDSIVNGNYVISPCDIQAHKNIYCPMPTPTPTPTSTPSGTPFVIGGCNAPIDCDVYPATCCAPGYAPAGNTCQRSNDFITQCFRFGDYDFDSCACTGGCDPTVGCSPIVVDVLGNGFALTNANNGINFDLDNDGDLDRHAWTKVDADDAWLALDRNNNGIIDSGKELFGSVSPQEPWSAGEEPNGFRSLALYDGLGYGGNSDGRINRHDAIFDRLKLWRDENHNGVSETCELYSLPDLGLRRIDLDYRVSERIDAHGNQFKYRSRVYDAQDAQLGRWAWDVFLVVQP